MSVITPPIDLMGPFGIPRQTTSGLWHLLLTMPIKIICTNSTWAVKYHCPTTAVISIGLPSFVPFHEIVPPHPI